MPVRCIVTDGITADCSKAGELIGNTRARGLIADQGYDSNKIVKNAENLGMKVIIPPRKNRKIQRNYDKNAYKPQLWIKKVEKLRRKGRLSQFQLISCKCRNDVHEHIDKRPVSGMLKHEFVF